MGHPIGSTSRFAALLFVTVCVFGFIGVCFLPPIGGEESWGRYVPDLIKIRPPPPPPPPPTRPKHYHNNSNPLPSTEIYNCADPYRRPGYLFIDEEDHTQTQWLPYTDQLLDAEAPESAQYPAKKNSDVQFNKTEVETEFRQSTANPQQWMQQVVTESYRRRRKSWVEPSEQTPADFEKMKDDGGLSWLWGRRVLMLGDSVDRFMTQFFCEELGYKMTQPKAHTTATCEIPTLNLTLIHWHHAGSFTFRPDWWWMNDMHEIPFEERWDTLWEPTIKTTRGPNGRPDLLLWQNGLWDERALWENGEAHYDASHPLGQRERQLVWQEVRFITARVKKLVNRLASEFGTEMPTMFRAFTLHRESNARDANLYELDRVSRAVAEHAGHEVFEWGRLISGFSMLYKDQTHPGKGAASWLWSNMVLEYLARGAGVGDVDRAPYFDGWDACHKLLSTWGGR